MSKKQSHKTQDYLFCGTQGQFWSYRDYKQVYQRWLIKNQLDSKRFTPYNFRHFFATEQIRSKVDLKTLQMSLGDNTSHMVLKHYCNMDKEDVYQAGISHSSKMDQYL